MTTWTNVESKPWATLSTSYRTVILLLAICATMVGLFLAVFVGGPFARALFGVPVGFREHFTSNAALGQAFVMHQFKGNGRLPGQPRDHCRPTPLSISGRWSST